ncbi:MAG: hypothetical protein JRF36_07030 [Deltaproteobacteria bacterium]|jgi:hypothetical protein|nr:hypothetical protein [Deltaproteobacteria bacterium]MBW2468162.1 hypothetical protein [Deltaproteobacteria bacterium]MBW2485953.1 hypothetical protein [Deltaproteobacteria bacterium]MBW2515663.1 hypothetical protein [Deltaproteobacteria bacterium]
MTVKFIQYWDVLSEREDEFSKFVKKSYIPGINETGYLRIVGSWHVAAGEGPYSIMEGVADSVKNVHNLLQLEDFKKLSHLLHFLITNYKSKLLVPTGPVEGIVPADKNYRFNHHYDVNYDKYDDYMAFIINEHIPTMEELGVKMIGGWYVAIGPGPNMVVEGACPSIKTIMDAIGSERYRRLVANLLSMVNGFGSKILVDTGLLS